MERGDVHLIPMTFHSPTGQETKDKYVVLLRGGPDAANEYQVPFVVASSLTAPGRAVRRFEVVVGVADGFHHETVIDCRWVHTLPKPKFSSASKRQTLTPTTMRRVSAALVVGLQFGVV